MTGDPPASGENAMQIRRSTVQAELSQLRRYSGLTVARIRTHGRQIQRLARAWLERENRSGSEPLPSLTAGFVKWGLATLEERALTDPLKIGALKAAYGIDIPAPYPNTATNRRDSYSKRLESQGRNGEGAVGPAADTLLTWENEVLPELAEVLIAAATGETPGIRLLPEALPERRTRTAVNDATYLFSSAGVVQEGYVVREIEALRDSVSEVEVSHSYINDPRPGVLRIQPYTNCDLIRTRFTPAGYLHARLRIPSLPREKRTRISYRLLVTSQVPCRPLIKVTPRTYEDRAIIRLQFHSDYLPHHLWRLNSPSDIETPELPSSGNLLGLSTTGYLELTLFDLVPGLSEGVSWKWPEDRP